MAQGIRFWGQNHKKKLIWQSILRIMKKKVYFLLKNREFPLIWLLLVQKTIFLDTWWLTYKKKNFLSIWKCRNSTFFFIILKIDCQINFFLWFWPQNRIPWAILPLSWIVFEKKLIRKKVFDFTFFFYFWPNLIFFKIEFLTHKSKNRPHIVI